MPDTEGHELRTFFNGPKGGIGWECWCGQRSTDIEQEFMDQASARRDHDRHQSEQEGIE